MLLQYKLAKKHGYSHLVVFVPKHTEHVRVHIDVYASSSRHVSYTTPRWLSFWLAHPIVEKTTPEGSIPVTYPQIQHASNHHSIINHCNHKSQSGIILAIAIDLLDCMSVISSPSFRGLFTKHSPWGDVTPPLHLPCPPIPPVPESLLGMKWDAHALHLSELRSISCHRARRTNALCLFAIGRVGQMFCAYLLWGGTGGTGGRTDEVGMHKLRARVS